MSQAALDISRPEQTLTRTGLSLKRLGQSWQRQARGKQFLEALLTFLGSAASKNTRRSYSFAILEFWDWYEIHHHGDSPTPDKVRRADAFGFADWLRTRTIGLDEYRLRHDPDRALDLAIYQIVLGSPSIRFGAIRKKLLATHRFSKRVTFLAEGRSHSLDVLEIEEHEPRGDALAEYVALHGRPPPNALDIKLACLVEHKLLRRTPTVARVRDGSFPVEEELPDRAQLDYRVDPETFSYFIDTHTEASGVERSSTVAQRLGALSSFWNFLLDTGENEDSSEPLLQHNVWLAPFKAASRLVPARKTIARELSTPSLHLFTQILSTTLRRSHGAEQAYSVAEALVDGADVSAAEIGDAGVYDLRDRALLLFTLLVGARAEEMTNLRRSDITSSTPALVTLTGKGNKQRLVRLPNVALRALSDFWEKLDELSAEAPPGARVHALTEKAAPLFPTLKLWGRNGSSVPPPEDMRGLSRSAIAMMMRRRAGFVGIAEGSDEMRRVHPHGIRHLASQLASARGVDARTIQATLGHASLATTGLYVEERDASRRSLVPERGRPAPVSPPPTREVIETTATVAEEPEPAVHAPEAEPGPTLTGVGELPEEAIYIPSEKAVAIAESSKSVSTLLAIYENNWGEKGKRVNFKGAGLLAQTYVGKRSGLPWWQGMTGKLHDPEFSYVPNPGFATMPIISPAQFIGTSREATCDQPLCGALIALWEKWFDDETRGPTAARALSAWIQTAASITRDVEEQMIRRRGGWVRFTAPLDETVADPTATPRVLREHLDGAIVAWFEAVAWQHRPLLSGEPADTELEVPSWYGETDPLASIPTKDRAELLDWLNVFVGLPPRDRTPRFEGGLSRRDVGEFVSAICQFEMVKGDSDLHLLGGLDKKSQAEALKVLNQQVSSIVSRLTRGRVRDFNYQSLRMDRRVDRTRQEMAREAAERRGTTEEKSEELRTMYAKYLAPYILEVAGELFGQSVRTDPVLEIFSYCTSGSPLAEAGDKYKNLFRVAGDTIGHTREFATEFARETGQHSECVARRIARQLFETGALGAWAKRRNWPETIGMLDAMTAYRIPCPRSQESELASRLTGSRAAVPVFEEWKRARQRVMTAAEPEEQTEDWRETYEQERERSFSMPTPRRGGSLNQNPRAAGHDRFRAARSFLPNDALLALWATHMG